MRRTVRAVAPAVAAAAALLLGGCSVDVVVTPASRADMEWNGLTPSEQRQVCDLNARDSEMFREATFETLRTELGWTNETSMWEYWIVFISHCGSQSATPEASAAPSSTKTTPATPTIPTAGNDDLGSSGGLGESGYSVADERAYLEALRSDPLLGEIGRTADDEALFVLAVPICVGIREGQASRPEVEAAMESVNIDPRYISAIVDVALEHLCPE